MNRRNFIYNDDDILDAIKDSDFGEDSDEDENWLPPEEEPKSPTDDEESEYEISAPVVATPVNRNIWSRRMFRSKTLPSVTSTIEEVLSPAEYFEKYFTENVYEKFALNTNVYYQTSKNEVLKQPITAAEVKKLFGVNGILGCVKYPRIKMAWLQRFKLPYITDAMARDRFFLIRTNLHIVD